MIYEIKKPRLCERKAICIFCGKNVSWSDYAYMCKKGSKLMDKRKIDDKIMTRWAYKTIIIILTMILSAFILLSFKVKKINNKIPTNNIEYVDSFDSNNLKYPFIIKDGEVYQLTERINWEVLD